MKRAERRHHVARLKAKAKKIILNSSFYTHNVSKKRIGKFVTVHGAFCSSGRCCGNPRRYHKEVTLQEKKNLDKWVLELEELEGMEYDYNR